MLQFKAAWKITLDFCRFSQCILLFSFAVYSRQETACGEIDIRRHRGTLVSPNYPLPYPGKIYCDWRIHSPPNSILKLIITDLDIEKDDPCVLSPCCTEHGLTVPQEGGRGSVVLCGSNWTEATIMVSQSITHIQFYSSKIRRGGRGFELTYNVDPNQCQPSEMQCDNGKCIRNDSFCNGIDDCGDKSDESRCLPHIQRVPNYAYAEKKMVVDEFIMQNPSCAEGNLPCAMSPNHCYHPAAQHCNGQFDCPKGEDEVGCAPGCPQQIACSSGDGCFHPSQRCNNIRNCRDNSDETGCPDGPCGPLQFVCLNGACVAGSSLCDGDDDCGDLSDEENCTKSSLMTAAIMGLLACIFIFCIGLSCLYRVYTARLRASAGFVQRLEPEALDEDFVYREPPPAYSVAINDTRVISYPTPDMTERFFEADTVPRSHRSRSARRHRRRSRPGSSDPTTPRSRPRPSFNPPPSSASFPQPPEPRAKERKEEGRREHCGFLSPCSSPSLSPSRESVTSSTSLEDMDLVRS